MKNNFNWETVIEDFSKRKRFSYRPPFLKYNYSFLTVVIPNLFNIYIYFNKKKYKRHLYWEKSIELWPIGVEYLQ